MSFWMNRKQKDREVDLVLTSSGVRASAFIGCIEALQEKGYYIKRISGASGGAVIAASFALGKSIEEMRIHASSCPYGSFQDFRIRNLFSLRNPSVYSGKALDSYYQEIFGDAKLKDFELDCKIVVVTIMGRKRILLDKETYPDLSVWKAVRMSSTIPFIFPYYELNGMPVTDGGLDVRTGNIFPDRTRSVIVLRPRSDYNLKKSTQEVITYKIFIWNYLKVVAEYLLDAVDLQHLDVNEWEKTIIIPTFEIGGFNFDIKESEILKLIQYGYTIINTTEQIPTKN